MKKAFWWLIGIAASPFIIFLLLTLLLYCPPIQRWAVGKATQYASESTGKEISIQDVRLRFPLDLQLDGVRVLQQNDSLPQVKDTIIDAQRVICNVQLRPLLDKKVEVDILQLDGVRLNTTNFISDCRVKGTVGQLLLTSHGIDLKADTLCLNKASICHANLDICLSDTAKEDTTKTPSPWKIRLQNLDVAQSRLFVHMPGDTLNIYSDIDKLKAKNGYFDLENEKYQMEAVDINGSRIKYDNTYESRLKGLDFNHIDVKELNIGVDSFSYVKPDINFKVRACNFKEKSGLTVETFTSSVKIDSTSVHVSKLKLATPTSHINSDIDLDFNTFSKDNPGQMTADIDASFSKDDIMLFAGKNIPNDIKKIWPAQPSTIKGKMRGNMKSCMLDNVAVNVPTLAYGKVSGTINDLDSPKNLRANARLDIYAAKGNGRVNGNVSYSARNTSYKADLNVQDLNVNHFMPGYGLGRVSADVKLDGCGTDVFSRSTAINANANIRSLKYGMYNFSGSKASLALRNGKAHADIITGAKIMNGHVALDAVVSKKIIKATIGADVKNIDFYALHLTQAPMALSVCGHIDIDTDLKDNFKILGNVSDIRIQDSAHVYRPNDIEMDIFTRRDTTHAIVNCGDFNLNADARGGYKNLLSLTDKLGKEFNHQMSQRIIDEQAFRKNLPTGHVYVNSGPENPIARFARSLGYDFAHVYGDITSSPSQGLNGTIEVDSLIANGIQLDNIDLKLNSDSERMAYSLRVVNKEDNPQYSFTAMADGQLNLNGTTLSLKIDDVKGKRGVDVNLAAVMEEDGIHINVVDDNQILGYRQFKVNPDNYVILQKDMRIMADMRLVDEEGTGIQIYTDDGNATALQDVTFSIHQLDIADIISVVPYLPKITGVMDGDFHVIVNDDNMSISGDIDTRNLVYEGWPMGNISTELTYMPKDDGSHYIDGILLKDNEEIAMIEGTYYFGSEDRIDANVTLEKMPMDIINGFIPDQIIGMKGIGIGTLNVKGMVSQPVVNGKFDLSQASLVSVPYGVTLKLDDTPVEIVDSKVVFDSFKFYASNDKPIEVNGYCDFANLNHINTDLRIVGRNVMVINAKETRMSEAYGKAYVNIFGSITGEVDRLKVRAKLDVLPSTNLYYILRDSPITTDNRMKELVTFSDLTQEKAPAKELPTVDGININMDIAVNEGSHIVCWINSNHTNYLDIIGGGDLRFSYANSKMALTGRYTVSEGSMKYSLPVIPLKTFNISSDSYFEFTGDIMNPKLNITATEQNRASVTGSDGTSRPVDFTCGVILTKTLQDMGLQFTISAPEDQSINDELNMMSLEDRGKLAVTMLTTGMYLTDANTSHITMNSALSSFLQQEINNIAGSALKTLDVSLGMENSTQPDGTFSTDYSFKFAKRFWNNRLSISIGGRISTGTQASGKTPSFFDNVDVQYRLSDTSNQYVGLFYKHDVYDYLEGYVDQYGVNYTWKRKLQNLKEIFPWVKTSQLRIPTTKMAKDSTNIATDSIEVKKNEQ